MFDRYWVLADFYLIIALRIKVIGKYRNDVERNYDASDNKLQREKEARKICWSISAVGHTMIDNLNHDIAERVYQERRVAHLLFW